MAKAPPVDQFADLTFPRFGIDLSQPFSGQQPGTTVSGLNVRTFEAQTQRGRGGSRPGLGKYIPQQLPSGSHLIQHLNVIVDPSGDALLDIDDGDFPDPSDAGPSYAWGFGLSSRNPGRKVRRGGNGSMRFKNKKKKQIVRVQSNSAIPPRNNTATSISVTFNQPVTKGNLLVAVVPFGTGATITDSLGNTYQQVPQVGSAANPIYFAFSGSSGACTVTDTEGSIITEGLAVVEYSGVLAPSPLDGNVFNTPPGPPLSFWDTTAIPVAAAGDLGLAVFQLGTNDTVASFSAQSPATIVEQCLVDVGFGGGHELFNAFFVVEQLPIDVATDIGGTGTSDNSWNAWGTSFKKKP